MVTHVTVEPKLLEVFKRIATALEKTDSDGNELMRLVYSAVSCQAEAVERQAVAIESQAAASVQASEAARRKFEAETRLIEAEIERRSQQ